MTKFLIWGIGGRLGSTLVDTLSKSKTAMAVGGVDKFTPSGKFSLPVFSSADEINIDVDCIIDFSRPDSVYDILPYAKSKNIPLVLCTTGHSDDDMSYIKVFSEFIPIFKARNMSLGVNLLIELCKKAAAVLGEKFDIEIIEQHHNVKVDSPSGTALAIAEAINQKFDGEKEFTYGRHSGNCKRNNKEIGIHAVRGGTVVGKHEVLYLGNDEIIGLSHEAGSKTVFTEGAIRAGEFIIGKPSGMYDMPDLLEKIL